jgi:hypothetical protein
LVGRVFLIVAVAAVAPVAAVAAVAAVAGVAGGVAVDAAVGGERVPGESVTPSGRPTGLAVLAPSVGASSPALPG